MNPHVAVCGPGVASEREAAAAEEIGRRLAEGGAVVVCGGMTGVMDAAARGARAAGGAAIGILPGRDRAGASEHLSAALPTGMGEARNALVVRAADVVVAIAGEFGTLSEVALALKMAIPVVWLWPWDLSRGGRMVEEIVPATTAEEAAALALDLLERR